MRLTQSLWTAQSGWTADSLQPLDSADLVLVFGGRAPLADHALLEEVRRAYPSAHLIGCSTAGEICDVRVTDDSLVATAVRFEQASVVGREVSLREDGSSVETGERLGRSLDPDGLRHVFVLSDGLDVNGSDLVSGLAGCLPPGVTITGGLSGDGDRFEQTLVLSGDDSRAGTVAALGLYGAGLQVGYASLGGWDPFGPERVITRSKDNVLYELDGRSALQLYKEYLGEHADGLPATGLLFPLAVRSSESEIPVVRTILAVDEDEQSLTFAGDVPEGDQARLMKANFNRLVDGAAGAAKTTYSALGSVRAELAILISCVGRKMVLKQRVEEEVEAVRDVLGGGAVLTGFYSYGEISPFTPEARCELHNQTMTITAFAEG
ncbi:MAG: FIST N-terminal domain-containing protein [Planctomycetota bacterium]